VPVRRSVLADHIVCLDCGEHFSVLKRHLMTDHKLTPEQYRQRWELPFSYPLVAPDYAKTRSALAKKIGLGHKGLAAQKKVDRQGPGIDFSSLLSRRELCLYWHEDASLAYRLPGTSQFQNSY
jgi:ROS/MUCR transcriptional regulator protein